MLHVALTSAPNKKGTEEAPVPDRGAVFCALCSVGTMFISHVHEREIQMFKRHR